MNVLTLPIEDRIYTVQNIFCFNLCLLTGNMIRKHFLLFFHIITHPAPIKFIGRNELVHFI